MEEYLEALSILHHRQGAQAQGRALAEGGQDARPSGTSSAEAESLGLLNILKPEHPKPDRLSPPASAQPSPPGIPSITKLIPPADSCSTRQDFMIK